MRKIITLQLGQCGNQIGYRFWKRLAEEHGIGSDGIPVRAEVIDDRKDIFFYRADDGRFIPRAVLIDLEQRVINHIKASEFRHFYNPENTLTLDGGGAGNNWGRGYDKAKEHWDAISDVIRREIEVVDALEGFIFSHSVSGGTGSGLGSLLLERFDDEYAKAMKLTFSVFPDPKTSAVQVEPLNTVLSLQRLIDQTDGVVVLDNAALNQIAETKLQPIGEEKMSSERMQDMVNDLVSLVMAGTTTTLRFPGYSNTDLLSLLAPLSPIPSCHFLVAGYTPLSLQTHAQVVRKTSVIDVMNRLLDPKNFMVTTHIDQGRFISILNVIQGDIDPGEVQHALSQIRENKALRFVPWAPMSIDLALSRKSPFIQQSNRVTGLMLGNHTNIRELLDRVKTQAMRMVQVGAGLQHYSQCDCMHGDARTREAFQAAIDRVQACSEEYQASEDEHYGEPEAV